MSKLDINSLLAASLKSQSAIQESECPGCQQQEEEESSVEQSSVKSEFNINLEGVAHAERVQEVIGESTLSNIRGAIASAMAVQTVLEARQASRIEESEEETSEQE